MDTLGFPGDLAVKNLPANAGDAGLIPGSGRSWRRKWQSIPVFLFGKSQEQRSLVGYSPWGHKRVRHNRVTKQQRNTLQFPFREGECPKSTVTEPPPAPHTQDMGYKVLKLTSWGEILSKESGLGVQLADADWLAFQRDESRLSFYSCVSFSQSSQHLSQVTGRGSGLFSTSFRGPWI